jgi:hypothetical protein
MAMKKAAPVAKATAPGKTDEGSKGPMTKADAVRAALAKGIGNPTDGVKYIKLTFGVDMPKQQFSVYKSEFKKRAGKGKGRAKAGAKKALPAANYVAPPPKARVGADADVLIAAEAIKPFVSSLGAARVKRIVDLLG